MLFEAAATFENQIYFVVEVLMQAFRVWLLFIWCYTRVAEANKFLQKNSLLKTHKSQFVRSKIF